MKKFISESYQESLSNLGNGPVPSLGFGTWKIDGKQCTKAVKEALSIGFRHLDTAQAYGNEEEVGAGLKNSAVPREEVFLTTKQWREDLSFEGVKNGCEKSLKRLGTDYLDLFLIHWPNWDYPLSRTLSAMAELVQEGKVRHVGVSNFNVKLLEEAVASSPVPIFTNQVEYHPYLSQKPVLDFCRRESILLTAYSPLARGKVMEDETLSNIGAKYGKNAAQVTLRWLLQQEGVVAIPKSANPEHIKSNYEVFDFQLDDEDMAEITEMTKRCERVINPANLFPIPEWDT